MIPGIDIVENCRLEKHISDSKFLKKILSHDELNYYNEIENDKRKLEFLCGRFAAKEAIIKVTTNEINNYSDIDIKFDDLKKLVVTIKKIASDIAVSISHETNYTVAIAIRNKI